MSELTFLCISTQVFSTDLCVLPVASIAVNTVQVQHSFHMALSLLFPYLSPPWQQCPGFLIESIHLICFSCTELFSSFYSLHPHRGKQAGILCCPSWPVLGWNKSQWKVSCLKQVWRDGITNFLIPFFQAAVQKCSVHSCYWPGPGSRQQPHSFSLPLWFSSQKPFSWQF